METEDVGPTTRSETALAIAGDTDPSAEASRHVADDLRRVAIRLVQAPQTAGESHH